MKTINDIQDIQIRKSAERGQTRIDWLESAHTFSFGDYHDPKHQGFADLRVINDDVVAPGGGFGTHPHRDMEIITYVLSGALEHKDSLGNGSIIRPGDVQRMSAGTGIFHSEFNASSEESVHLLQIWIFPDRKNLPPSYEQKQLINRAQTGAWQLLASPDGRNGTVTIHQDALVSVALLTPGQTLTYALPQGRNAWLQVAQGTLKLGSHTLETGDGVAVRKADPLLLEAVADSEVLLFDMKE